jgi:translation initiation factor IF-1
VEVLSQRLCRVEFQNGHRVLAHFSRARRSESRQNACPAMFGVGDKVTVEMSPFDFSKGRIWLTQV